MVSVSVFARKPVEMPYESASMDSVFADPPQHPEGYEPFVLRRTGMRPFAVIARELASATSYQPGGAPFWYEVNLFSTVDGGHLIDIRRFDKTEGSSDLFRVIECYDLDSVIEALENFDPASDIVPKINLEIERSTVELAIAAATLKLSMLESRRQFRELVGDILHGLEA
jgi:hypothetical protein